MNPNKYPAILFIAASFVLAWITIGLVTWAGSPTNSLHTSAQSWAFVLILATLATFGLTSITDIYRKPS